MPRRRYQRGMLTSRGKRRRKWIGTFRADRFQPDGTIRRVRRKVVLGLVKHMTKLEALQALQPYLDAVNLVAMPKPTTGRTLKKFAEEWEASVATTLKPGTVRAAKSHLRTHIIPAIGDFSLTAITTRNVQAFVSHMAAKGLTRKTIENVLQTLSSLVKNRQGLALRS